MALWPHLAPTRRNGFLPCVLMTYLAAAPASAAGLSGTVYVDENMNGKWDWDVEWVLPNIEMHLVCDDPIRTLVTWTDENGYYAFDDLLLGSYTISQFGLLQEYVNVKIGVGELLQWPSGDPWPDSWGTVVQYDPANDVLPQVTQIGLGAENIKGVNYDFGQIWLGKFLYLARGLPPGDPPHANPPPSYLVPEPATLLLLGIALLAVCGMRLLRRGRWQREG